MEHSKPAMKLDLNAAWDQTVRLIGVNREMLLVLGGVFFFLPTVVFSLAVPVPDFAMVAGPEGENTEALMAAMNGFVAQYWWAILLLLLVWNLGALAVMAVIGDPTRPTVGQAVRRGLSYLPTQFGSLIVTNLLTSLVLTAAFILGILTGSQLVAQALALLAFPVIIWLLTRWSLSSPTVAIEKTANPLAALRRSWGMTRGNALRLLAFYVLLFAAFFVVSQVLGLLFSVIVALPGAGIARVIEALLSGLLTAVLLLLIYAVLASVHRQLARAERVSVPGTARAD